MQVYVTTIKVAQTIVQCVCSEQLSLLTTVPPVLCHIHTGTYNPVRAQGTTRAASMLQVTELTKLSLHTGLVINYFLQQ